MTYGIDVSENNGRVDWNAVAQAGQKFAIVRSSSAGPITIPTLSPRSRQGKRPRTASK